MKELTFKLDDIEEERYKEFIRNHKHKDMAWDEKPAAGGTIAVTFVQTSIGLVIKLECSLCDTKENITNFDSW